MIAMIQELSHGGEASLHIGLVQYRDHPPQDTMVYRVHAFEDTLAKAQKTINGLDVGGGGDAPEAVLDGVLAEVAAPSKVAAPAEAAAAEYSAQGDLSLDELAARLESSRPAVAASLSRLGARGLLQ
jgi:hypothetical protein